MYASNHSINILVEHVWWLRIMLPLLFPTFCFYDIVKVRPNIILAEKVK